MHIRNYTQPNIHENVIDTKDFLNITYTHTSVLCRVWRQRADAHEINANVESVQQQQQ